MTRPKSRQLIILLAIILGASFLSYSIINEFKPANSRTANIPDVESLSKSVSVDMKDDQVKIVDSKLLDLRIRVPSDFSVRYYLAPKNSNTDIEELIEIRRGYMMEFYIYPVSGDNCKRSQSGYSPSYPSTVSKTLNWQGGPPLEFTTNDRDGRKGYLTTGSRVAVNRKGRDFCVVVVQEKPNVDQGGLVKEFDRIIKSSTYF